MICFFVLFFLQIHYFWNVIFLVILLLFSFVLQFNCGNLFLFLFFFFLMKNLNYFNLINFVYFCFIYYINSLWKCVVIICFFLFFGSPIHCILVLFPMLFCFPQLSLFFFSALLTDGLMGCCQLVEIIVGYYEGIVTNTCSWSVLI